MFFFSYNWFRKEFKIIYNLCCIIQIIMKFVLTWFWCQHLRIWLFRGGGLVPGVCTWEFRGWQGPRAFRWPWWVPYRACSEQLRWRFSVDKSSINKNWCNSTTEIIYLLFISIRLVTRLSSNNCSIKHQLQYSRKPQILPAFQMNIQSTK